MRIWLILSFLCLPTLAFAEEGLTARTPAIDSPRQSSLSLFAQTFTETDSEEPAEKSAKEETSEGEPGTLGTQPEENGEEPGGARQGSEKSLEEPQPEGATGGKTESQAVAKAPSDVSYGAGFSFRGIFIPTWFLNLFLDASTSLNSVALGGEFIRRKGNFDLVASVNLGFYSPSDGNYLGNGKKPEIDTDYVQFRGLNLLSFEAAFVGHQEILPWLSMVYGAGLGLGIVLGNIYRISNYENNCHGDNVSDLGTCNPLNPTSANYANELAQWKDNPDGWIADRSQTCKLAADGKDTPREPCLYREDDVWPVVPMVHLLIGLDFKISEQFSVRVDGGFHNAFYFGTAGHYFF